MGTNAIYEYYQQIADGSIVVGKWIRLLYEYIVHGLEQKTFDFDQKKANTAIRWIEKHCRHVEGPLAPQTIKLELWQKALISCIFGICDNDSKTRRFREVVLVVARKNGKSLLASAIANYVFQVDGGFGCRVYNLAPKLEQSDIIYSNTWAMIQLDPEQKEKVEALEAKRRETHQKVAEDGTIVKKRVSDLFIPATNSTMKKISNNAKRSDGFNPSLCICDEIASWEGEKGLKAYEVMKSGMGARPEALMLSCTTSGYVNDSVYDEIVKRSTRFLLGDSKETRLLPFLYMSDDIDAWNTVEELQKSNPNLGVSVKLDYLLEEIAIAEGSLSKRAEFIVKYNCIKQNSSQAWLNSQDVAKCISEPLQLEDFRHSYAVGGIDLSRTTDLTAACVVIQRDEKLYVFAKFFLPREKIDEATARDGVPYRAFIQRGILQESGDNFVDYNDCLQWFQELVHKYQILPIMIGYDRYNSQYLVQEMKAKGFKQDDVYQGENLSPVIDELEGLIKDGKVCIGDNDLLKMHLLDSATKQNAETLRKRLIKVSAGVHIDGVAALLDAMTVRQKWWRELGGRLANERKRG